MSSDFQMSRSAQSGASAAVLLFCLVPVDGAFAQSNAQPATVAGPGAQTVTVTGTRSKVINKVDRKVYKTDADLQSTTGNATDVLNNIPSVEVDPDGNVSLRGNANVSILIDGKPAADMQGAGRGAALQGMSASDIQQIEIITSPSAEFKPDGSAGIINIVTKKVRKRDSSELVQANLGNEGRYNASVSGTYTGGLVSLHGSLGVRNDIRRRDFGSRTQSTGAGASGSTTSHQSQTEANNRKSASAGIDLTPNDRQTVSLSLDYSSRDERRGVGEHSASSGALPTGFDRLGYGGGPRTSSGAGLSFDQKTSREDEDFTVNLQTSQSVEKNTYDYVTRYSAPSAATAFEQDFHREAYAVTELSVDYVHPLSNATLKLGYDGEYDQNRFDDTVAKSLISAVALVQDHSFDNGFRYRQTIHAAFATFDHKAGKLEWLAGLRLEQVDVFTLQTYTGSTSTQSYGTVYPSLNAVYALSEDDNLTSGFGRRVRRRDPEDLNPYINASDPNILRQGNPDLKPEMTNSVEIGYRHDGHAGPSYQLTGYYRKSRNGDTEVLRVISSDVVLIREANLPSSRSGGVEFGFSGKVSPKLSYNVSGNAFYNEVSALALGAGTRSTIGLSAKASLDYQPSLTDRWQVSSMYSGKRLTAQGYVLPVSTLNVGYRHQLNPKVAVVATVSDLFNSQRGKRLFITPAYTGVYERHPFGRVAYIGLSYTFGGNKKSKDDFSYDQ